MHVLQPSSQPIGKEQHCSKVTSQIRTKTKWKFTLKKKEQEKRWQRSTCCTSCLTPWYNHLQPSTKQLYYINLTTTFFLLLSARLIDRVERTISRDQGWIITTCRLFIVNTYEKRYKLFFILIRLTILTGSIMALNLLQVLNLFSFSIYDFDINSFFLQRGLGFLVRLKTVFIKFDHKLPSSPINYVSLPVVVRLSFSTKLNDEVPKKNVTIFS